MLRSYDPQLGRFLQHDPYDQFASGYVGMGNDPVNGVDPSGGLFGGGSSIGCAATAGMSGFGGFSNLAKAGLSFQVFSTVISISSITINGLGLWNTLDQNGGIGDPPTKKPPLQKSKELTDKALKEIFEKKKPRVSPNPLVLLISLLLSPSDANSRIDDTPDGIGGWKKLEREQFEQERAEDDYEDRNPDKQIKYVTYTKVKVNSDGTTTVYSGRTSGSADESAEDIVRRRDAQHSNNPRLIGYGRANVDREAVGGKKDQTAKWAIRGREQQLIDRWGGAQRDDNGTSGNLIRGVSKYNKNGRLYHESSNIRFRQELHRFTGIR